MLRCPPSRITLTSADLDGLERRLAARRSEYLARPKTSGVRLSPGPAHPTRFSVTSAESNSGIRRAASSLSEATLHDAGNAKINPDSMLAPTPYSRVDANSNEPTHMKQQESQISACYDGTRLPVIIGIAEDHLDVSSANHGQKREIYHVEQNIISGAASLHPQTLSDVSLDGANDSNIGDAATERQDLSPHNSDGQGSLREIQPSGQQLRLEPRTFSRSRARRRNGRVDDYHRNGDSMRRPDRITMPHTMQSSSPRLETPTLLAPIPGLLPSGEIDRLPPNPALDPGAPVFVPRTRFGSATGSASDVGTAAISDQTREGSDVTVGVSNLRIRSSSERNKEHPIRNRLVLSGAVSETITEISSEDSRTLPPARYRRANRNSDQNASHRPPARSTRAPEILRPPERLSSQHEETGLLRLDPSLGHPMSRPPSSISSRTYLSSNGRLTSHVRSSLSIGVDGTRQQDMRLRSVSPMPSTSSRSTPNLLHGSPQARRIDSRLSSLSWNQYVSSTPNPKQAPNMVSGASGASGGRAAPDPARQFSREGLDAATEFQRFRNSPLDELTETLSRIAASRQRSVGRSWERPPAASRTRISLLNGDPFRQESTSDVELANHDSVQQRVSPHSSTYHAIDEAEFEDEDRVMLALPLPPSSLSAIPQNAPSTPPICSGMNNSAQSAQKSSAYACGSPRSAIKRKPVPTPQVKVYDDSKPPNTQPETPAAFSKSRHSRHRSEASTQSPAVLVGRAMMGSPPTIPERHSHRNTYPTTASNQVAIDTTWPNDVSSTSGLPESMSQLALRERNRRRTRAQRTGDQAENDIESQFATMEDDRGTWHSRRVGDGTLETTPPCEGRFEQFLS